MFFHVNILKIQCIQYILYNLCKYYIIIKKECINLPSIYCISKYKFITYSSSSIRSFIICTPTFNTFIKAIVNELNNKGMKIIK